MQVEAAYDVLLMQSMRSRLSGEMDVKNSVRFADVQPKKSAKQVCAEHLRPCSVHALRHVASPWNVSVLQVVEENVLSRLPGGGVSVAVAPRNELTPLVGGYAALIAWAFIQGATEPYAAQQADVAGLQLALGLAGAVYYLRDKKRLGLGRSFLYGCGGLVAGSVIGNLIEPWLRVDIVPLFGMGSPGVFVGEFGLLGLAATAICLA